MASCPLEKASSVAIMLRIGKIKSISWVEKGICSFQRAGWFAEMAFKERPICGLWRTAPAGSFPEREPGTRRDFPMGSSCLLTIDNKCL
jgi:hypothetical protein